MKIDYTHKVMLNVKKNYYNYILFKEILLNYEFLLKISS